MSKYFVALVALILSLTPLIDPPSTTATSNVTGRHIVLDPGHGGTDTGTTECQKILGSAGILEKDANLQIAFLLKDMLAADGASITMTREGDINLSNRDRYTRANEADGAEVLVSIHLNGSTDHTINRNLGLWGKRNKDLEFTQVIHAKQLEALYPIDDEGIRQFASGVLLKSNMPATISESVYLSNTDECKALTTGAEALKSDPDGIGTRQRAIANSLYLGLNEWFKDH